MRRVSTFELRLHEGKAPPWLITRMEKVAKPILELLVINFGTTELLRRLADPLWFQALSYVLGYDWDSSGVTTVTIGVLKGICTPDLGLMIAGGKGRRSLRTPEEIVKIAQTFGFSESKTASLIRASRLAAKVDNAVLQDEHKLYHHAMLIDKNGNWAVIQQGMCPARKTARRYHWTSLSLKSFVIDPHEIIGDVRLPIVLNMASSESINAQKVSLDLVKDGIESLKKDYSKLMRLAKRLAPLDKFLTNTPDNISLPGELRIKLIPMRLNWEALNKAYEIQPSSYEELVEIKGLGPGTIRALALIAELIYDAKVCWKDPIRYTFAHGGKDGVPYQVNVKRMEEVAEFLESIIEDLSIGKREKLEMLNRLSRLVPRDASKSV
ncbi:MAG: DUF763 domain-containing protein [Candidatus Korarchaeota archaeon]|nr:DUF763 domain-containing protein [Thermoproteota archaeon]MCR8463380.1 DUF763 domain-containing protein [Thermoproteota archaeon]MCR8470423.1 DUF763 domain-containing protein [Thermoproteota archaeon]MCR8471440.1 DUF763 domain-containing protein [Thermoproteota archaeon]MCR8473283.1 DUF763 domain-containing protein [Thermoproteota archaeon]